MKRSKQLLVLTFAASSFILISMSAAYAATANQAANQIVITYTLKPPYTPAQGMAKLTEYSQACTNLASVVGVSTYSCQGVHARLLPGQQAGAFPLSLSSSGILERIIFGYNTPSPANLINVSTIITNYNDSSKFDYTAEPGFAYSMAPKNLQALSSGVIAGAGSCGGPNDPLFCDQWALDNQGQSGGTPNADINVPGAWNTSEGEGIVVAILDTGVDYTHPDFTRPDLTSNIWINSDEIPGDGVDNDLNGYIDDVRGWNFVSSNNNPMDTYGSGTHSAGIIAAVKDNGVGIAGIAPRAKIMPLKVGNTASYAQNCADPASLNYPNFCESVISQAVAYAILNGADVILMNFSIKDSNFYYCGQTGQCTTTELKFGYDSGVVLIAPAGTFPSTNLTFPNLPMWPRFPAAFGSPHRPQDATPEGVLLYDVLAVGTTNHFDGRGGYGNYSVTESSYGGYWIEIAASGMDIISTVPTSIDPTGFRAEVSNPTGAAHVAGVAALMKAVNPEINHTQVKDLLISTKRNFLSASALATHCPASPIPCNASQPQHIGVGVIDATAAVNAVPSSNEPPVWRGVSVDRHDPDEPDDMEDTVGVHLDSNKMAQLKVLFDDPDGDNLTITVQAGYAVTDYTFDQTEKIFRWTATPDEIGSARIASTAETLGTYGVRFIANDGQGNETMGPIFEISVPWNCEPNFSTNSNPPPSLNWHVWEQLDYNMYGADGCMVDGAQYQFISFHVTPVISYNGNNPTGINLNPLPPGSTYVNLPYSCHEQCNGRDCVTVCSMPHGRFSWRPLQTQTVSPMQFYISDRGAIVYDAVGNLINDALLNTGAVNPNPQNPSARLTDSWALTLNVVNEAPVFTMINTTPIANQTVNSVVNASVGVPLSFTLTATDAHNDSFIITANGSLPSDATFNSTTRTFSWPSPQMPDRTVTFTVQDYFDEPGGTRHWGMSSTHSVNIIVTSPDTENPTINITQPPDCTTDTTPEFRAAIHDTIGLQNYTLRLYRRSSETSDLTYGSGTYIDPTVTSSFGVPNYTDHTVIWSPGVALATGFYRYDIIVTDNSGRTSQASKNFKIATSCVAQDADNPLIQISRPLNCETDTTPPFIAGLSDSTGLQDYTLRLYRRAGDTSDTTFGSGTLLQTVGPTSIGGGTSFQVNWSPASPLSLGYYRYDIVVNDVTGRSAQGLKTFKIQGTCSSGASGGGGGGGGGGDKENSDMAQMSASSGELPTA